MNRRAWEEMIINKDASLWTIVLKEEEEISRRQVKIIEPLKKAHESTRSHLKSKKKVNLERRCGSV